MSAPPEEEGKKKKKQQKQKKKKNKKTQQLLPGLPVSVRASRQVPTRPLGMIDWTASGCWSGFENSSAGPTRDRYFWCCCFVFCRDILTLYPGRCFWLFFFF